MMEGRFLTEIRGPSQLTAVETAIALHIHLQFGQFFFFLRDFIFKKTLLKKLQYLKQEQ